MNPISSEKCHSFGVKMTYMRPLGDGSAADLPDGDTCLWLGVLGRPAKYVLGSCGHPLIKVLQTYIINYE